jgi:hypothetical protein
VDETASKITASAEAADHEPSHALSEHDGMKELTFEFHDQTKALDLSREDLFYYLSFFTIIIH